MVEKGDLMVKSMKWNRLNGGEVKDLYKTISEDINKFSDEEIKFYVGTDSQRKKKVITYVTAIVLYRVGSGALVYYSRQNDKIMMEMGARLWNETYKAVEVAKDLNLFLKDFGLKVHEVHADLNPDDLHKSNTSVQACLGYICGMGFKGKIKPYAWASTWVANKKTKGGNKGKSGNILNKIKNPKKGKKVKGYIRKD